MTALNNNNNHKCVLIIRSSISEGSCDTEDWSNDDKLRSINDIL